MSKKIFLASFLLVFSLSTPAFAETIVNSNITQDTTWTLAGSPYIITTDITVRKYGSLGEYATLTIQPGVIVKFNAGTGLYFGNGFQVYSDAALNAQGTPSQPIIFTSNQPDGSKTPGFWKGITFLLGTAGHSTCDYCVVEYGGNTTGSNININNVSLNLSHLTVTNSSAHGIYVLGNPSITTSSISSNGDTGVYVVGGIPTIANNNINNNATYPIKANSNTCSNFGPNTSSGNGASDAIALEGNVTYNVTWPNTGLPYIGTTDITVRKYGSLGEYATLTIQPGVTVKFDSGRKLYFGNGFQAYFDAALNAQGTPSQPITFTSNQPDGFKTPGFWQGIIFDMGTTSGSICNYCVIEYGGDTTNANLTILNVSPTISNSTMRYSSGDGIRVAANSYSTIASNTIDSNINNGIYSESATPFTLSGNNFINNGQYAIQVQSSIPTNFGPNTAAGNGHDAIGLMGNVIADTVWPNTGLSYIGTTDISIQYPSGMLNAYVTLTVQPGAIVKFDSGRGLYVSSGNQYYNHGSLNAQGTSSQPVIFTSNQPDGEKTPGYWKGLIFRDGTKNNSICDHCIIEYGGNITNTNVSIGPVSPTISNSTIRFSSGDGIYVIGPSTSTIALNTIASNANNGIYTESAASFITLSNNNFTNNTQLAANIQSSTPANFGLNTASGNGEDAIGLRGNVYADAVWPNTGLPYVGITDISIQHPSGQYGAYVVLTIQPGVAVKFNSGTGLYVSSGSPYYNHGGLNAQGTSSQPIIFTSNQPDGTKTPGFWKGITFREGTVANSICDYCVVEYGGNTTNAGIYVGPASPYLPRLTLANNAGYGIYVAGEILNPQRFNFLSNTTGGVFNASSNALDFKYSWWNDASGPSGAGTGQSVSGNVNFEPWSGEPVNNDFYFFNADIAPQEFNQNGDATVIHAEMTENIPWQIAIKDSAAATVRNFSGTGNFLTQSWIGDDNSNQPLPNGTYTYTMSAASVAYPGTTASLVGQLVLDDSLLLPIIKNNAVSQRFFKPRLHTATAIQYTLTVDATVTIKIFDFATSNLVRTLVNAQLQTAGDHAENWDGKNDSATLLPDGAYYYTIDAETAIHEFGQYAPPLSTAPVLMSNFSVAPSSNFSAIKGDRMAFSYDLTAPAKVTLGNSSNGGMTFVADMPSNTTGNTAYWDGRWSQGQILMGGIWVEAKMQRYPENFIVIADDRTIDIDVLKTNPYLIRPVYNEITTVTYNITESADVTVKILNQAGNQIISVLQQSVPRTAGTHSVIWDGKTTAGDTVITSGDYRVRVEALDAYGKTTVRDGNIRVVY